MSTPRINVDNHLMWGRLVKSWATGRDYVNHNVTDADPVPAEPAAGGGGIPQALVVQGHGADVQGQPRGAALRGNGHQPKTYCTGDESVGFVLLQGTSEISILRLPAKEKVHESEAALLGSGGQAPLDYTLPSFYGAAFGTPAAPLPMRQLGPTEKMEFHAQRVGEYTINTCA